MLLCPCGCIYLDGEKDLHEKSHIHKIWILKDDIDIIRDELFQCSDTIDKLRGELSASGKKLKKYLSKNDNLKASMRSRITNHDLDSE